MEKHLKKVSDGQGHNCTVVGTLVTWLLIQYMIRFIFLWLLVLLLLLLLFSYLALLLLVIFICLFLQLCECWSVQYVYLLNSCFLYSATSQNVKNRVISFFFLFMIMYIFPNNSHYCNAKKNTIIKRFCCGNHP